MSTQAYDARQVSAHEHVGCNRHAAVEMHTVTLLAKVHSRIDVQLIGSAQIEYDSRYIKTNLRT